MRCAFYHHSSPHTALISSQASTDGSALWGVVVSTRWWLLVDHCVLRNWGRILVRVVKGLISRAGMVSICPLLWQRDVKLQQTKSSLHNKGEIWWLVPVKCKLHGKLYHINTVLPQRCGKTQRVLHFHHHSPSIMIIAVLVEVFYAIKDVEICWNQEKFRWKWSAVQNGSGVFWWLLWLTFWRTGPVLELINLFLFFWHWVSWMILTTYKNLQC